MFKSALAAFALLGIASTAQAQDWRTVTSLRQYRDEAELAVEVEYGAGRLTIGPASSEALYRALLRYDANAFKPVTRYGDGRLRLGIEGGSLRGRHLKDARLDLSLSPKAALDLDLKFGAVEADVELGGLRVRAAHIATGASETILTVRTPNPEPCSTFSVEVGAAEFKATGLGNLNCREMVFQGGIGDVTLDFNGAWSVDGEVDIDMGLGSLTLQLPRGLGVSVRKQGVLASFDSQELIKRGDMYYSANWEQAENRLTFDIDAALGAIRIVWVEPEAEFRKAQR